MEWQKEKEEPTGDIQTVFPAALPSPDFHSRAEQKSAKNEKCMKKKATDSTNPPSLRLSFSLFKPRQEQQEPTFKERRTAVLSQSQIIILPRTVKGQAGSAGRACTASSARQAPPSLSCLVATV